MASSQFEAKLSHSRKNVTNALLWSINETQLVYLVTVLA